MEIEDIVNINLAYRICFSAWQYLMVCSEDTEANEEAMEILCKLRQDFINTAHKYLYVVGNSEWAMANLTKHELAYKAERNKHF